MAKLPELAHACWELSRLHNNIGFWVVWLPTAWSIAMVYHAHPHIPAAVAVHRLALYVPLCFGIKSLVINLSPPPSIPLTAPQIMTVDDILDADIDALVERTKDRPLPRGAISPPRACIFFAFQVIIGLYLAFTCLSPTAYVTSPRIFFSNSPPPSLRVSMFAWPIYIIYPTCKARHLLLPVNP